MKIMRKSLITVLCVMLFILLTECGKKSNPVVSIDTGGLQGVVSWNYQNGAVPASQAYLFIGDSLMATTDETGQFEIPALDEGKQFILCSALFAKDTTVQINIAANKTSTLDILLTPDSTIGRVYGEFQDMTLFREKLTEMPEMAEWTELQEYEGTTGATYQMKWLDSLYTGGIVTLGDQWLAYDDGFGQYWFKIQAGTYPITGSSEGEGYLSQTRVITVLPDDRVYLNFYLNRE